MPLSGILMKTIILSALLITGAFALLTGCTTSHVLVGHLRPATDPAQVKVYYTPPKHYEPIAVISADSRASFRLGAQGKVDAAMERAKREAASLGANGLLFQNLGEGGPQVGAGLGTKVGSTSNATVVGISSGGLDKTVTVVAVFVTEE